MKFEKKFFNQHYFDGGDTIDENNLRGHNRVYTETNVYGVEMDFKEIAKEIIDTYAEIFRKPLATFLDYGCAKGYLVRALHQQGLGGVGIDVSEYAIQEGTKEGVFNLSVGDETTLDSVLKSLAAQTDLVNISGVLQYLSKEQVMLILKALSKRKVNCLILGELPFSEMPKSELRLFVEYPKLYVRSLYSFYIPLFSEFGYVPSIVEGGYNYIYFVREDSVPKDYIDYLRNRSQMRVGGWELYKNVVPNELLDEWVQVLKKADESGEVPIGNDGYYDDQQHIPYYLAMVSSLSIGYFKTAKKFNNFFAANLKEWNESLRAIFAKVLEFAQITEPIQFIPRNPDYYLSAGFKVEKESGKMVKQDVHTDTNNISIYPELLMDSKTIAYTALLCVSPATKIGGLWAWDARVTANEEESFWGASKGYPYTDVAKKKLVKYEKGQLVILDSFTPHTPQSVILENGDWRVLLMVSFVYKPPMNGVPAHFEYFF